jgi:hypothetical protein
MNTREMKKIIYIIFILSLVSLSGCKKFLEQEPYNRISVQDIFKDFEGALTTLVGCYDNLRSSPYYLRDFYIYPELTGGNVKYSRPANRLLERSYRFLNDSLDNDMGNFYETAYSTIYNCNNILSNIDKVADATQGQKNRLLADALVIRALAHFDLMRVFAQPYNFTSDASHQGVNLRTVNTSVILPVGAPQTAKEVFNQVVFDLDSAINLYPKSVAVHTNGVDRTWLSQDAARALLSRVTLYKQDWARTIALSNTLISSNRYPLVSTSQYVASWSKKNISSESIFELAFGNRIGGSLGDYYNPTNALRGHLATSEDLMRLYSLNDVRDSGSMFVRVNLAGISYRYTRKYQGMNDSANNIKIIRLSEVYLNRAEAYAETGDLASALADLNVIRKRANPAATNFVSTNKQLIIDEILVERRRELAFEGHTFFDLARRNKNISRGDCTGTNCSFNYPNPKYAVPKPINQ